MIVQDPILQFIYLFIIIIIIFQILTVGGDVGQVDAGKKVMPLIV